MCSAYPYSSIIVNLCSDSLCIAYPQIIIRIGELP